MRKKLSFRSIAAAAFALVLISLQYMALPALAQAQQTAATIAGQVSDQDSGIPVRGAALTLYENGAKSATTATDAQGRFSFAGRPPGSYSIDISSTGFAPAQSDTIFVVSGSSSVINVTLTIRRAQTSSQQLRQIARVQAGGRRELQTSTTIHNDIEGTLLRRENYVRVGDALNTLPGVNLSAQSSALGDDIYVNLRGVGATETATLLDGHPIGPVGVAPGTFFNGAPTAFDYQDTPAFALGNVQAVYGNGALGLYGTDSIGGAIDLQTLQPTRRPEAEFSQGFGNYGKATTVVRASGMVANEKLGYVLLHGVQGTYGNFAPQTITQTGVLSPNFSTGNAGANSYLVSANYLLHTDLLKLRYDLSKATQLTLTGYSGVSWDDKSGNGDNDFQTYDQKLYNGQQTIAKGGSTLGSTDSSGNPIVTYSCAPGTSGPNGNPTQPGIAVTLPGGSNACVKPAEYAAFASGPAGGGPSPWQAIRNQDYHARLTSRLGVNNLVLDGYFDNYALDYNRNVSGGLGGPNGNVFVGGFDTTFTRTNGLLVSDDIVGANNDVGFGFFALHQSSTGTTYNTNTFNLDTNPALKFEEANYFVRDAYTPTSAVNLFFNAWIKHTTVTNETKFDPRLSLVLRPTGRDVFRFTGGSSTSAPVPSLREGTSSLNSTPQNLNPNCTSNTAADVGGVGNPKVASETGSGEEFAYGHNFVGDTNIQLSLYNENVYGKIFNINEPISVLGASAIPTNLLNGYVNRITSFCGNYSGLSAAQVLPLLTVTTPVNAAVGKFRGIELSGRYRFDPHFYMDYSYDVQSATLNGIPDAILQNQVTAIPGAQVVGIPLHKAAAGLDVTSGRGFEARLDTYFVGDNNGYNRPQYFYSNASISQAFGHGTMLNVGIFNVFDSATDRYGRFGLGPFQAENRFGTDRNAFDQGSERFALPPTQIEVTLSQRVF